MRLGASSLVVVWSVLTLAAAPAAADILIEGLSGPVTSNEVVSFKQFMATRTPSGDNIGNDWVYGNSGMDAEAMGMMYEITGDTAILDRMIEFADVALAVRNDPSKGRVIFTGKRELCWPNKDPGASDAKYCGTENGDVIGHLAFAARLILGTPGLGPRTVPTGDPHGFGATYEARARRYVAELDRSIDTFIVPNFVVASDANHYRWPDTAGFGALGSRQQNDRGKPIPWNQQTMLNNGFIRLAESHRLLGDDPARVARYDAIVQSSLDWFVSDLHPGTSGGHPVYDWGYSLGRTGEDTGHGAYDAWGVCRAADHGTAVNKAVPVGMANTLAFVMYDGGTKTYAQRVDGTSGSGAPRDYVHTQWMCLCPYLTSPDLYTITAATNLSRAKTTPIFAAFIFTNKARRAGTVTPTPTPTSTAPNLALNKPATASTTWSTSYTAAKTLDGRTDTRWSAASGKTTAQWVRVDLGTGTAFARVVIKEPSAYPRVTSFRLQSSNDGTTFADIGSGAGTTIGTAKTLSFTAVTARYVRLFVATATDVPTIAEIEVYSH
jgi:hypothetical protein